MKQFLFVTYYYPPAGGPSVQRIIRIIEYMAKNDWQCVVLTVKDGDYTTVDPHLEQHVPAETKVIRTSFFEPYQLYRRFTGKKQDEKIPLAVLSAHSQSTWKERLANVIRANIFIPDGRIGWYRTGVKAGLTAIKNNPDIQLVFSSGPPHTVHLIAMKIARITKLPFIADFRDPWVNIDYYSDFKRNPITVAFDRYLEGKVLSRADAITVVGPGCRDQILEGHQENLRKKTHIVYNGFDPDAYPKNRPAPPRDRFILTYIGNLPFNRFTPSFYQAISELKNEQKISPDKFQLHFYGRIDNNVRHEIEKFHIEEYLNFHNFVPHSEAIRATLESHLLLLIINDTKTKKGIVPGKMFEYLASERFVLAIGPLDGDAAKIYYETGCGKFFEYNDVPGIKNFLIQYFENWKQGNWQPIRSDKIHPFKRSEQFKKLLSLFNSFSVG